MNIQEYEIKMKEIEKKFKESRYSLKKVYAFSNSDIEVGDIVTDHIGSIKVNTIEVTIGFGRVPYCVYRGECYTKKSKRFKNGEIRVVHQTNIGT